MIYSNKFKERVLAKMLAPGAVGVPQLAKDVGVCAGTLYRWRHDRLHGVLVKDDSPDDTPKKRSALTALDTLRLVLEANELDDLERGAFLRREGLHQADLDQWQAAIETALAPGAAKKAVSGDKKRVVSLEKELRRKDKALAEAAALLVLRKKAQALLGDEDDDTTQS